MCILTRVQTRCYGANFPVYWPQFNEIRAQIGRLCPLVNESNCTHMISWEWLRKLVCQVLGARFEYIRNVRYLSEDQLIQLFPEATLEYEKALGMVKSFYVYYVAPGVETCKEEAQGDNPPP